MRGRARLAPEIRRGILAHILRDAVTQQVALLVENAQADAVGDFRLDAAISQVQQALHERIELSLIFDLDILEANRDGGMSMRIECYFSMRRFAIPGMLACGYNAYEILA